MKLSFLMDMRPYWLGLVQKSLKQRPIVWLAGVRRSGKTSLCRQIPKARYFDCERPQTRREVEREGFWDNFSRETIVLDEVHRLANPAEILKIAADHYSSVKVVATGSSTLAATGKFRDSLTGRKVKVWLTPANSLDTQAFHVSDLKKRLRVGGLPPFLLASSWDEQGYQEWLDSFWSRDIQELFRVERRASFIRFFELLMAQSGGLFEASSFAGPCEVSRPTIANYLSILETTLVAHVIRPFSKRLTNEIVAAPKVYGFDTGFVTFAKGWESLDSDHAGVLFEHWVLNEFHSFLQHTSLHYWRDKAGHEVDFVWVRRGKPPVAIECKWQERHFDPSSLRSFRNRHPEGINCLVSADKKGKSTFREGPLTIVHLGPDSLREWILAG